MNLILIALVFLALTILAAYFIRQIVRVVQAPRPRKLRRAVSVVLLGFVIAGPVAFAAPQISLASVDDPAAPKFSVVRCDLPDRDPELVASAIAANNPRLLDQLAISCSHADGAQPKLCKLQPAVDVNVSSPPALPACFSRALPVELLIYDPLNFEQVRESTLLWLDGEPIDNIYINRTSPEELLVIGLPDAKNYDYALKTTTYSDTPGCREQMPQHGNGTIPVHNGSIFVVAGNSCNDARVWLEDWMSEN